MLKSRYTDNVLVPERPLDLREETSVVLQVLPEIPSGLLGFLTVIKVRAVYQNGVFRLRRPLKVQTDSEVAILAFSPVRSLESFQGILSHVKEDCVTLQHQAKEWWVESAR